MRAQCTHLCTGLGRGRCRASQDVGSYRHHFGAEFYGFSWVLLIFTQSLKVRNLPSMSISQLTHPLFLHLVSSVWGPLVPSQPRRYQPQQNPSALCLSHRLQLIVFFSQADPRASLGPEVEMVTSAQGPCLTPAAPHDPSLPRPGRLHSTLPPMPRELSPRGSPSSHLLSLCRVLPSCQFPGRSNMPNQWRA